jgi:hypothetical protein
METWLILLKFNSATPALDESSQDGMRVLRLERIRPAVAKSIDE